MYSYIIHTFLVTRCAFICSSRVRCAAIRDSEDQLSGVADIQATQSAFAALKTDGSVVSWGEARAGGNSCEVQRSLRNLGRFEKQTDILKN